jgi:hypothetical protein
LLAFACAGPNAREAPPGRKPVLRVPLDVHQGHAYVRVRVNGAEPVWFLLDTGAAAPVHLIDGGLAGRLGITTSEERSAGAIGGTTTVKMTKPASIVIGDLGLPPQPLAAIDLVGSDAAEEHEVAGILGYPLFEAYVVELDYVRRLLTLYAKEDFQPGATGEHIALRIESKAPVVRAVLTVDGRPPIDVRLIVDTGYDGFLVLNSPLVRTLGMTADSDAGSSGAGLGGVTRSRDTVVKQLVLGNLVETNLPARLSLDESGPFASSSVDGFVGGKLLEKYVVTFDYRNQELVLSTVGPGLGPAGGR